MKTLKKIIGTYMYQVTAVCVVLMVLIVLIIQVTIEQNRAYETSMHSFSMINSRLEENEIELGIIQEEYKQTCLYNAEVIASIIEDDPEMLQGTSALRELAVLLEVDEIHIFDETGCIFAGTHPEYYNYTFDSGDQMSFFRPMLEDKTLKLVQEITPNTAEGKLMQYSAIWSDNGRYIVQVGMEPVNVEKVTEKNEISYIFSTFKFNAEADFYDIDATSGEIIGSTNLDSIGCNVEELGIDFDRVKNDSDGFHARINDTFSFCVFKQEGSSYYGRVVSAVKLYERVPTSVLLLSACLVIISFLLAHVVLKRMNTLVVDEIHGVNKQLNKIAHGDFNEIIETRSSLELSELSDYINVMLKNILNHNIKMSYVLNKTDLLVGIYEYNNSMNQVQFTETVPQILSMEPEKVESIAGNIEEFQLFIKGILSKPVEDESNVYQVEKKYIKLEEIVNGDDVFGVVMDVTADVLRRKEIEIERDIDTLTGLYNRRGLDAKLEMLFAEPEKLRKYAMIMIDIDGLKLLNDTYGYECGDVYLKKVAAIIHNFGIRESIASRQGGDEFVLFLYDYDSEDELIHTIETLQYIQSNSSARIREDLSVPLEFSMGYCYTAEDENYLQMIKEADKMMYQNKLKRRENTNPK